MCATVSQPWDEWDDSRVFVGAESGHVALRALLRDAGGPESSPNDDVGFCTFAGPSVFPRLHRRVQRAHSVHVLLSVVSAGMRYAMSVCMDAHSVCDTV